MKKILSLLALVLMSCMGAWADYTVNVSGDATRPMNTLCLNGQQIDVSSNRAKYQDLTSSATFTINAGENVTPKILWGSHWLAGYVYVDVDQNGEFNTTTEGASFTIHDDLVSVCECISRSNGYNNQTIQDFNAFSIATPGTYRMRYKVDWNNANPNTIEDGTAQIIDVTLNVVTPPAHVVENGIYEIKNVSNEGGVGRGYLIDYTGYANGPSIGNCQWTTGSYNTKHPSDRNDGTSTCSYWYVYNNQDGTVYVFSLSSLSGNDWPKFLNVSATGSWSDSMVALDINPNTSYSGAFSIRNHGGGDGEYLSMACGTNSTEGAIKRNGMSDGGNPLSFIPVQENALDDDQRYIMNYGIGVIEGTAPIVRVSNQKDHYFHINCNGRNAYYFNTFTFPTQTENERGVFQFYRVGETAKVYIKEAGSGKYLAYSNTNNGAKKITLTDQAGASQFTVVNSTTYYNIGPSSSTSFNWFGGIGVDPYRIGTDDVMNTVGFYGATDGNSKWNLNEVTGDAATTAIGNSAAFYLTTYKNKALSYNERIGLGLGYYSYNGGSVTGYSDAVDACEDVAALEDLIATIAINQPVAGSFIRFKGGVSNEYVDANALADKTNRAAYVGMSSDGEGAGSIWYLDNNKKLISFSKGYYITNTCEHSGTESNASSYIFEASNSTVGRYYIHTSGAVFYDNGSPADRNCLDRQGLGRIDQTEKWTLEEVTTLPVALTKVGELAYATFNAPVAVAVPSGVTAYSASVNGSVLELAAFEGTDLAANTPVILTAETAGNYNFNIVESGDAIAGNDLLGTVAKKNVATGKTTYVLNYNSENKIGFYKSTTFINGFKAYTEKDATSSESNALSFRFDDVLTAIEAIQSENSGAEIYDLQGRRLTKAQKGMNIINGHKVLVK